MDRRCRICRVTKNLKFARKIVRQQILALEHTGLELIRNKQIPTALGNICRKCDAKLQEGFDFSDDELNVDDEEVGNVNRSNNEQEPTPCSVHNWLINSKMIHKISTKESQLPSTQQHQPQHQEKQRCLPSMYNNHSLGSDGDTEIVEVLSSRESTPGSLNEPLPVGAESSSSYIHAVTSNNNVSDVSLAKNSSVVEMPSLKTPERIQTSQTVLETIDLSVDDDEVATKEPSSVNTQSQSKDDFGNNTNAISSSNGRKRRKVYNEKEQRLVGSFNLISDDDSEAELPPLTHFTPPASSNRNQFEISMESLAMTPKRKICGASSTPVNENVSSKVVDEISEGGHKCKHCSVRLPNSESLAIHQQRIHEGIQCKLCSLCFPTNLRLVIHMRRKHRQCVRDDILCEQPRNPHDSAMTIRLRYLEQNYYECQICDHIDDLFKTHMTHIKDHHANEVEMLKSTMSSPTKLKCCVCKFTAEKQTIELVRHLVEAHENWEYRKQMKVVNKVYNVQEVAVVYELQEDKKKFFFKCKRCCQVVPGFFNHKKHQAEHKAQQQNEQNAGSPPESEAPTKKLRRELTYGSEGNSKWASSKVQSKPRHARNAKSSVGEASLNKKAKPKTFKVTNSNSNPHNEAIERSLKKLKTAKTNKKNSPTVGTPVKKSVDSSNCARGQPSVALAGLTQNTVTKAKRSYLTKKRRQQLAGQIVKVKVKPPIRQFPTKKYQCDSCKELFEGFIQLNMHKCETVEFPKCARCNKIFFNEKCVNAHQPLCCGTSNRWPRAKQLRKPKKNAVDSDDSTASGKLDENFNKRKHDHVSCVQSSLPKKIQLQDSAGALNSEIANSTSNALPINYLEELIAMAEKRRRLQRGTKTHDAANVDANDDTATQMTDHQTSVRIYAQHCRYCCSLILDDELASHNQHHYDSQHIPYLRAVPLPPRPWFSS